MNKKLAQLTLVMLVLLVFAVGGGLSVKKL
jgi:hypothetical protein